MFPCFTFDQFCDLDRRDINLHRFNLGMTHCLIKNILCQTNSKSVDARQIYGLSVFLPLTPACADPGMFVRGVQVSLTKKAFDNVFF